MATPLKKKPLKPAPARKHAPIGGGPRGRYDAPELLAFVSQLMAKEPAELRRIRETTALNGLPPISVGPDEGKILDLLVRVCGARKAVEIGTLAGYSGSWIAGALPEDGELHTFEYSPKHAEVARRNFQHAGLSAKISIHVGAAAEKLREIEALGPFDFVFIDADKVSYGAYARWAAENLRPGGLMVADNAYLFGKLHLDPAKAGDDAAAVPAMRQCLSLMADESLFSSCSMLPTGEGMAVAVRRG